MNIKKIKLLSNERIFHIFLKIQNIYSSNLKYQELYNIKNNMIHTLKEELKKRNMIVITSYFTKYNTKYIPNELKEKLKKKYEKNWFYLTRKEIFNISLILNDYLFFNAEKLNKKLQNLL